MGRSIEDFDEGELGDALSETEFLHALGGRTTGPAPPVIWGAGPQPGPQQVVALAPLGPDTLALDGTRMAVLGGRKFELTPAEMKRVIAAVETAYARAMKGELLRVRESVLGTKTVREVSQATSTANPSNVPPVPRPRPLAITYRDTANAGEMLELRPGPETTASEVRDVPGTEAAAGPAVPDPLPAPPRGDPSPRSTARIPLRRNGIVVIPAAEGGGTPSGRPD